MSDRSSNPLRRLRLWHGVVPFVALAVVVAVPTWAKLVPAPGEDGLPPDPDTEDTVDAINEHIQSASFATDADAWQSTLDGLLDDLDDDVDCLEIEAPPASECAVADDTSSCDAPCAMPRSDECALSNFDHEAAAQQFGVRVENGLTLDRNAEQLVEMAWAIMMENTDLLRWVACMYYGGDGDWSVADCITHKVDGSLFDISIKFVQSTPSDPGAAWAHWDPIGGTIYLPVNGAGNGTWFDRLLDEYNNSAFESVDEFCVAAYIARTLAHELSHTCPFSPHDNHPSEGDQPNSCTTSYLIGNGFAWALAQRYPCLGLAGRCDSFAVDTMWGSDDSCLPDTDAEVCASAGAVASTITVQDNCGDTRTIACP